MAIGGPQRRIASISMAGGRGRRMGETSIPKVCFPVAGVPAINRTIAALRKCGVDLNVVVVGSGAGEVVRTVGSAFPDAVFAFQERPLGTGNAGRTGFAPLSRIGFEGDVIIHVGDKVIDESVIAQVLREFYKGDCDVAIATTRRPNAPDMGRVVRSPKGDVLGVVEAVEIRLARTVRRLRGLASKGGRISAKKVRDICLREMGSEKQCVKRLGRLWRELASQRTVTGRALVKYLPKGAEVIDVGGVEMTPDRAVAAGPNMHESLYVFRSEVLAAGLRKLKTRRDVGEEYLTDLIHLLASDRKRRYCIREVVVADTDHILGFNTPDQLLRLEEVVRRREGGVHRTRERGARLDRRLSRPVSEWLRRLEEMPPRFRRYFRRIYCHNETVAAARARDYVRTLRLFARRFGADRRVVVVRAPGSVNLMGRHVDVRGGYINVMPVDREVVLVASPRDDDRVRLLNVDGKTHPPVDFTIGHELAALDWDDWLRYISSTRVRQMITEARGSWGNFARAGALRLQQHFRDLPLAGMDGVLCGGIPSAAGMGASSAIVVAVSEAVVAVNGLVLTPQRFVHLCGEGEWYVAPQGTAGRHAASKLGEGQLVTQVRFFPMEVEAAAPFPDDWRLVLCRAAEQVAARPDPEFRNRQTAALDLGLMLIGDRFPSLAHLLDHVRDLNPQRLGTTLAGIYNMLLSLPQSVTRRQMERLVSSSHGDELSTIFATHSGPAHYRLRDVVLFGIAECARGRMFSGLLEGTKAEDIGAIMAASHDAERATRARDGKRVSYKWTADDACIRALMADLVSEDPHRVRRAQLYLQPGRYGSSRDAIDAMVDVAVGVPGVIGAQLSGSGQGGSAMVLVEAEAVDRLKRTMRRSFFRPRGLRPDISVCSPVRGSGVLAP